MYFEPEIEYNLLIGWWNKPTTTHQIRSDKMSKSKSNITVESVLLQAKELGIRSIKKAAFHKLIGPNGARAYVATSEKLRRFDVAFPFDRPSEPTPGIRYLGEGERFGSVKAQLDMTAGDDILSLAINSVLLNMVTATDTVVVRVPPMAPKKRREKSAPVLPAEPKVARQKLTPEQVEARKALIAKRAVVAELIESV